MEPKIHITATVFFYTELIFVDVSVGSIIWPGF
jgi:hypothetical protein